MSFARIEQLRERAILRVTPAFDPARPIAQMRATPQNIDVVSGRPVDPPPRAAELAQARSFGARFGIGGAALSATPLEIDQWTMQTTRRHQPLWRIDYAGGATAYVARSGEVVQKTTQAERFWG